MLEIGSVVDGKYKILNKIGQGGMSVVYLAMNEKANKQWAIKEVRKDGVQNYEVVKQGLIAETDMLKKLSHPNLPSIIDVIDSDDTFLIVMDYIQGNSLSKALEEHGAQPQEYVIAWAKQLCDVLGYLHTREPAIIYRDMKPSNVMLKPDGDVSLIDFGTAREFKNEKVEDTTCLGTRGYAAPEQFGGQGQTDARTDIYCLGATMYHLVTGHNPAVYPYEMKPIRQWNASLSPGLEEIILKCTRPDPKERYQTCNELLFALEHFEEQDRGYKKSQKIKMGVFAVTLALSMASGIVSTVAHSKELDLKKQNYDNLILEAAGESDIPLAVGLFQEAVEIDNTRSEAYTKMLKMFIDDNESDNVRFVDDEEIREIDDLLNKTSGEMTNIDAFEAENPQECAKFMEEYALILMFDAGEENEDYLKREADEKKAKKYFEKINALMTTGEIRKNDFSEVELYLKYLDMKSEMGRQGGSSGSNSYRAYFETLENTTEQIIKSEKLTHWQKSSYYWDVLDIVNSDDILRGFRNDKVSDARIIELLSEIEKAISEKAFYETIEDSVFWQKGYVGEGNAQTLEEYQENVTNKVKNGTDNSIKEQDGLENGESEDDDESKKKTSKK